MTFLGRSFSDAGLKGEGYFGEGEGEGQRAEGGR